MSATTSTPTAAGPAAPMGGLLAAEARKLWTVRTVWVLTGFGVLLVGLGIGTVLFAGMMGGFSGTDAQLAAVVDQAGSNSAIVLVVALLAMTTEFRHGTIGRTLQVTPSRLRVILAKAVVAVAYALMFLVLCVLAAMLLVGIATMLDGLSLQVGGETVRAVWTGAAGLALTALLGVALGALLRSQVLALTGTLVWLFVIEQLINVLEPTVGRWLPFQALNAAFLSDEVMAQMPEGAMVPLEPMVGLLVFLGYVVVVAAAALTLLTRRDV